jgi:excisionase family DNA binding protein
MSERWHSVQEISIHLGIAEDTIYRWIERGRLPAHRIGRLWKFKPAEVDDWVRDGRTVEAPAAPSPRGPRAPRAAARARTVHRSAER